MNNAEARTKATALLAARNKLLQADAAAYQARQEYIAAETAFLKTVDGVEPTTRDGEQELAAQQPRNVAVDDTLIMPAEDWYDMAEGKRVEFHTFTQLGR